MSLLSFQLFLRVLKLALPLVLSSLLSFLSVEEPFSSSRNAKLQSRQLPTLTYPTTMKHMVYQLVPAQLK